ncbi:MAG: hypothetical protein NTX61_17625 [Bacteroidetes bacterium]|nr:hypothetical protein [Bacteroidota bacterium]
MTNYTKTLWDGIRADENSTLVQTVTGKFNENYHDTCSNKKKDNIFTKSYYKINGNN